MIMGTWTNAEGDFTATLHEDATWKVTGTGRWPGFNDFYLGMLSNRFPPERRWSYGPADGEPFAAMLADVVAALGGTKEYTAEPPQDEDGEVVKY